MSFVSMRTKSELHDLAGRTRMPRKRERRADRAARPEEFKGGPVWIKSGNLASSVTLI